MKPRRPCRYPGCAGFCEQGQVYCKKHISESVDRLRGGAAFRGYDRKWREARDAFLRRHPLCVICRAEGKLTPATVVDHIIPHRGNMKLFWDQDNWQPLCREHHNKKTGIGL
jgi:5-methylcytosine-specific restriction protein A